MKRINRKKRFAARPWEVKYKKALLPKLKARARRIIQGMYDGGIIAKFQAYLFAAYPGFGSRSGRDIQNAGFDTAADSKALDRLAKDFAEGSLGLDDLTKQMTERIFGASSEQAFGKLGVKASWNIDSPAVLKAIEQRQNLISNVDDTQFAAVKDLIRVQTYELGGGTTDPAFLSKLQAAAGKASIYDAERIARTETAAVQSQASHTVWSENGVQQKEWIAAGDDRTRDSHAEIDGEIVDMDEAFSNGLQYPGDPGGDPGEVINCRCSFAPVVTDFDLNEEDVVTE